MVYGTVFNVRARRFRNDLYLALDSEADAGTLPEAYRKFGLSEGIWILEGM